MSTPKVEVRKDGEFAWSVFVNGRRMVDRESYQVAANVAYHLEHPKAWDYSESCEVADSIRRWLNSGSPPALPCEECGGLPCLEGCKP